MKLSSILARLAFVGIFWNHAAMGYVLNASVWQRWNAASQNYAYLVVLHDVHNYSAALNKAQIEAFKELIPTCKNLALVIENQAASAQEYRARGLYNNGAELQDVCMQGGCPIHEVDYRYKRVRAYYKCQHALTFTSPEQFSDLNKKLIDLECTTQVLAHEFEDAVAQTEASLIRLRDQKTITLEITNIFLNALVAMADQWKDELSAWKSFEGTFLDYCQQRHCLTAEYLLKSLTFDVGLLDIRMFIQALESPAFLTIVYAGGVHCTTLQHYLSLYSSFMPIASQGVSVDYAQLALQQTDGLSPAQITRYAVTAEQLITTQGQELTPLEPSFLIQLANPESFFQQLPGWKRKVYGLLQSFKSYCIS